MQVGLRLGADQTMLAGRSAFHGAVNFRAFSLTRERCSPCSEILSGQGMRHMDFGSTALRPTRSPPFFLRPVSWAVLYGAGKCASARSVRGLRHGSAVVARADRAGRAVADVLILIGGRGGSAPVATKVAVTAERRALWRYAQPVAGRRLIGLKRHVEIGRDWRDLRRRGLPFPQPAGPLSTEAYALLGHAVERSRADRPEDRT